jgi:hypothetical protein
LESQNFLLSPISEPADIVAMKTHGGAKWLLFGGILSAILPGQVAHSQQIASLSPAATLDAKHSDEMTYEATPASAMTRVGHLVTLPVPGRLTLVVGALSAIGDDLASGWQEQVAGLCAEHPVLDCYPTAPDARTAPRMAPADLRDRIAVAQSRHQSWKSALAPEVQDDVYAVLLAPDGTLLWQAAGPQEGAIPTADLAKMLGVEGY